MTVHQRGRRDTVVASAGPAGLACAPDPCRAGHRVAPVEASDGAGGRTRTGRRDGSPPDRGCQVPDTSCPADRQSGPAVTTSAR
ncbi:FAD-dependent oxidoreductase [Streptomyces sp. NPDC006294]|uniref:FAD-dependent oxidoreductase n=1 Tax=Streptomyces sp. NPDC006294 TaxID=3364743 RepID=UPI0036A72DDD